MNKHKVYPCSAWPGDKLTCYVTDDGIAGSLLFAFVAESPTSKTSALLSKEDAIALYEQLEEFIVG